MKTPLLALSIFCGSLAAHAAGVTVPVTRDTLPNGLRYIIVPDTTVNVLSCRLYYFVGSMYEGPGTNGLSHMFEHMMFKGTKTLGTTNYAKELPLINRIDTLEARYQLLRQAATPDTAAIAAIRDTITETIDKERAFVKKEEIWDLYERNGGVGLNAWTSDDVTAYIVTLPANKLELFCWIEADRMRNPVLREFFAERDVVAEERRMRYDNKPTNAYWERLNALFFVANPYRQPTIGWMSDIQAYTRTKMEEHIHRYYTPDNALVVLTGKVDIAQAKKLLSAYFAPIPRAAKPAPQVVTREPAPIGQTRFSMESPAQPRIDLIWHTPGYPHADLYPLDVVAEVLSGRSGRLYQRLVKERRLCASVDAHNEFKLYDGDFGISAVLSTGASPDTVEKIILDELRKLSHEGPTPTELERVKNGITMDFVQRLKSLEGLSDQLARFERLHSFKDLFTYADSIAAVSPQSIPAIVKKYLQESTITVGSMRNPIGGGTNDNEEDDE